MNIKVYSWFVVTVLAATLEARGQPAGKLKPPAATPTKTAIPTDAGPSTKPATMRFKPFVIKDDQGFPGMEVCHGIMPVDWTVKGGVTWKPALFPPQHIRIHWGDAQDVYALDMYPYIDFSWSNPRAPGGQGAQPGQADSAGAIVKKPPTDLKDAFDKAIIQLFRPDLAKAKVVSTQNFTNMAKAIHDRRSTNPQYPVFVAAGSETFEYELNGQTVQEALSGVVTITTDRQWGNKYWGVENARSRRTPKATFDQVNTNQAIIAQSLQMNPEWNQQVAVRNRNRTQQQLANQARNKAAHDAQFNAIEDRISSQSAANDAQHASYWQHSADLSRQSENRADVMREVSPWKAGDGSSYKLPTQYGHAWSGADGTIIMNNDPNYNPNSDPNVTGNTTWTPMEQSHN